MLPKYCIIRLSYEIGTKGGLIVDLNCRIVPKVNIYVHLLEKAFLIFSNMRLKRIWTSSSVAVEYGPSPGLNFLHFPVDGFVFKTVFGLKLHLNVHIEGMNTCYRRIQTINRSYSNIEHPLVYLDVPNYCYILHFQIQVEYNYVQTRPITG